MSIHFKRRENTLFLPFSLLFSKILLAYLAKNHSPDNGSHSMMSIHFERRENTFFPSFLFDFLKDPIGLLGGESFLHKPECFHCMQSRVEAALDGNTEPKLFHSCQGVVFWN